MRRGVVVGLGLLLLALLGLTLTLRIAVQTVRTVERRDRQAAVSEAFAEQAARLAARGQAEAAGDLRGEAESYAAFAERAGQDVSGMATVFGVTALITVALTAGGLRLTLRHRRRGETSDLPQAAAPDDPFYRDVVPARLVPETPVEGAVDTPSSVFLSYARKDADAVVPLHAELAGRGRDVWVDWAGIPPTADWMQEIVRAIDRADAVLFVVSPDSLRSRTCLRELAHAIRAGKRIIPVLVREVGTAVVPDDLGRINWVMCRAGDDRRAAVDAVVHALDLDLEWVRLHTRLYVRAREWETAGHDPGSLLGGADLSRAWAAVTTAAGRRPPLTALHEEYVAASERNAVARTRRERSGVHLASLGFGVLFPAVIYSVAFDEISESGLVMLTPVWVLALVFGVTGLTARRATWRRPALAVLAGVGILAVFFQAIFPVL